MLLNYLVLLEKIVSSKRGVDFVQQRPQVRPPVLVPRGPVPRDVCPCQQSGAAPPAGQRAVRNGASGIATANHWEGGRKGEGRSQADDC